MRYQCRPVARGGSGGSIIDIIAKSNEEKCQDVVRMWLDKGSAKYPVEWSSLIRVLQDVEMGTVAEDLKEALDNCIV